MNARVLAPTRPLRIVHVITRFVTAGSERATVQLMEWERAQGHDVRLVVGSCPDPSLLPDWLPLTCVPHLQREIHPVRDAQAVLELRRLFIDESFDVVHTHQSKAGIVGRVAARRLPAVVVHSVHMTSFGSTYGRLSPALTAAERIAARWTDVLAPVGVELGDVYLEAGVGTPGHYVVVRSFIDVERFLATRDWSDDARSTARSSLPVRPDTPIVVTAGSLESRKRHELILRELTPLLRAGRAQLVVAGEGPEHATLVRFVEEQGIESSVVFLGHVGDLERVFAIADLYVHAGREEGVPQVVIQAFAAGLPVVATQAHGLREIANAPISIVPADGRGLGAAASTALGRPHVRLPESALEPWSKKALDTQRAMLHERIGEARARKVGSRRVDTRATGQALSAPRRS